MKGLGEYFDRTYVINLRERKDRRREMAEHLAKFGIPVDGDKIRFFPAIKKTDSGGFPNPGVRGCFLSHLEVFHEARRQGLSNVLIMEDDLELSPLLHHKQSTVVENLDQTPWDMLFLGHFLDGDLPEEPRLERYTKPLIGLHFYAVDSSVLDPICAFLEKVLTRPPGHPDGGPMHVDGALSTFRKNHPDIITLISRPSLGTQRSSRSDIFSRWFDQIPVVRSVVQWARTQNPNRRT